MNYLLEINGLLNSLTFYAVECVFLCTEKMVGYSQLYDAILRLAKSPLGYGRFMSLNWQVFGQ